MSIHVNKHICINMHSPSQGHFNDCSAMFWLFVYSFKIDFQSFVYKCQGQNCSLNTHKHIYGVMKKNQHISIYQQKHIYISIHVNKHMCITMHRQTLTRTGIHCFSIFCLFAVLRFVLIFCLRITRLKWSEVEAVTGDSVEQL